MARICLYFRREPDKDRWVWSDRWVRKIIRRVVRGKRRPGGLDKVFMNLCLGLDRIKVRYEVNLPFRQIGRDDHVAVLGVGRTCLRGYNQPNKIVAGIGLMTHPSEWPTLCSDYPVARYLQHSAWCDAVYRPFFGDRCAVWPVGIDTKKWTRHPISIKTTDFLIYDKIHWARQTRETTLVAPIKFSLAQLHCSYETLQYGSYKPDAFKAALTRCRAMIFLSAHESQGIAAQEAMASGVPILAWDPGFVEDPNRFQWEQPIIPATSVPYFDARCGLTFRDASEFNAALRLFLEQLRRGVFDPRAFIVEQLTLEKSAAHFIDILTSI